VFFTDGGHRPATSRNATLEKLGRMPIAALLSTLDYGRRSGDRSGDPGGAGVTTEIAPIPRFVLTGLCLLV
jgi:hypothetical protein